MYKKKLRKVCTQVLGIARSNLMKDGYLQPCGLIYSGTKLTHVFPFRFGSYEEKKAAQMAFRKALNEFEASAAVVILESWIRMAKDGTLDLTRPVSEMPEKEVVVVEGSSPKARIMIIQVFERIHERIVFHTPFEPDERMEWSSEWLDGAWRSQG
ncbi:hypothetical protein ACFL2Q_11975 [Thermodesulfobacteriota bacterium]